MQFSGFVEAALGDKIVWPIDFIVKRYKELWIDEKVGEQYDPQIWVTVNGFDKVVQ